MSGFERFAEVLAGIDGSAHLFSSLTDATVFANELIGEATVARWDDVQLRQIGKQQAPPERADFSVIAADVGIVRTGAIGFVHTAGRPRPAGLLPPKQIALLSEQQLVEEVNQALAHFFSNPSQPPGNVVFVAGPSRTSDIQQRSIRGMHAPKTLDVLVYR